MLRSKGLKRIDDTFLSYPRARENKRGKTFFAFGIFCSKRLTEERAVGHSEKRTFTKTIVLEYREVINKTAFGRKTEGPVGYFMNAART